jgi:hypothetical protein
VPINVFVSSAVDRRIEGATVRIGTSGAKPRALPLRRERAGQYSASTQIERPRVAASPSAVTLQLVDAQGQVLDQQRVSVGSSPLRVRWAVSAQPFTAQLSTRGVPTLFGYGVQAVPRCPNPDESLPWA